MPEPLRCRGEGCGRLLAYPRQQPRYDGLCPRCWRRERQMVAEIEKAALLPRDPNKRHLQDLRQTGRLYG